MMTSQVPINVKNFSFKKDRYRKARGGTSVFLSLSCANCRTWLLLYQKDGPGQLLRLYLDRIHAPENLESLQRQFVRQGAKEIPALRCPSCNALIAVPMVYEKEGRLAYRLIHGTFSKVKA